MRLVIFRSQEVNIMGLFMNITKYILLHKHNYFFIDNTGLAELGGHLPTQFSAKHFTYIYNDLMNL